MRMDAMNQRERGQRGPLLLGLALLLLVFLPASGSDRRLQVAATKASIFFGPDAKSPVMAVLESGADLTLASDIKIKKHWFYVYFTSPRSGKTLSGYVQDSCIRRVAPPVIMVHISAEDEILNPKRLNFDSPYLPSIAWGTSLEAMICDEGRPYKRMSEKGLEILHYRRKILDKHCLVEYVFASDRLITTRFHLLENYADKGLYIQEYEKIKSLLNEKVGTPRADRVIWQDHAYERDNELWGQALSRGQLELWSEWVFRDTQLYITLAGENNRVVFGAEVHDVKHRNPASF